MKQKTLRVMVLNALALGASTLMVAQASVRSAGGGGAEIAQRVDGPLWTEGMPASLEGLTETKATETLPDAPSAIAAALPQQEPASALEQQAVRPPKSTTNSSLGVPFLAANGILLGSTIANIEMISNCRPTACQAVPGAIRSRADLYAIGIPSSLAISYLSYRLKRGGTKLWIIPVALFTAGNVVYAAHAAQFSH